MSGIENNMANYIEKLKSDLQAARADIERLKAQDLTHAVIAADVKLREEVEELKAQRDKWYFNLTKFANDYERQRDALAAKLEVANEALEFYANKHNWGKAGDDSTLNVITIHDEEQVVFKGAAYVGGKHARQALAEIGEGE